MTTGKPGFTEPKKEDVDPDTLIKVPVDATTSSDYITAANKAGFTLFRTFNPDAAGNESTKRPVPVNAGSAI